MSRDFPREPIHAVEIREVAEGVAVFIEDVRVETRDGRYSFALFLGDQRNAIWRVTPQDPLSYKFEIVRDDDPR